MNRILVQIFSSLIITFGGGLVSINLSWPSYALRILESDESPVGKITKYESSLVGSLPMLGVMVPMIYVQWMADTLGRKQTKLLSALLNTLSWSIISTATNIYSLMIGRFITGMGIGMILVITFPYISEICQTSVRGTMCAMVSLVYCSGTLVSYVAGWMCSYILISYGILSLCVIDVILISLLKESPAFLLSKGKYQEALKSLKFYRGGSEVTQELLDELHGMRISSKCNEIKENDNATEAIEKEKLAHEEQNKANSEISAWKILRSSKAYQRALVTTTLFIMLLVLGGSVAVTAYAGPLFLMASPTLSPDLCSIIVAVSFAVGAALAMTLTDLFGRRTLMMVSCVLTSLCLAVLSALLYWPWAPDWAIPAAVLSYCCVISFGMSNIPMVQLAETFPSNLKSTVSTITTVFMCGGNFIILVSFGPVVDTFGLAGTFLMFSIECAATAVIAALFMKETRQETTEAIKDMYERGYLYRNKNK